MEDRLACLDQAARQAQRSPLTPADRIAAADIAHKLAGSLGMFGYPEGTAIARELEVYLESDGPVGGDRLLTLCVRLRQVLAL